MSLCFTCAVTFVSPWSALWAVAVLSTRLYKASFLRLKIHIDTPGISCLGCIICLSRRNIVLDLYGHFCSTLRLLFPQGNLIPAHAISTGLCRSGYRLATGSWTDACPASSRIRRSSRLCFCSLLTAYGR